MTDEKQPEEADRNARFWTSRKFWIVVFGVAAVVAIVLGGTALQISVEQQDKAITAIEWLVGLLLGAHAGTDIASIIGRALGGVRMISTGGESK